MPPPTISFLTKPKYHDALMALEKRTPQGKKIKLEMLRPSFLSRSEIFERHALSVAVVEGTDSVVGVSGASIVPVKVEDTLLHAGFGYDLKVDPDHRKKRAGQKAWQAFYKRIFPGKRHKGLFWNLESRQYWHL